MTMYGAWSRPFQDRHQQLMLEAKRNEFHDTRQIQQVLPAVTLCGRSYVNMGVLSGAGLRSWLLNGPRRITLIAALDRHDQVRACRSCEMLIPEVVFLIIKLPFGLRREMFSIVLRQSCSVLRFLQTSRQMLWGTGRCETLRRGQKSIDPSCKNFL